MGVDKFRHQFQRLFRRLGVGIARDERVRLAFEFLQCRVAAGLAIGRNETRGHVRRQIVVVGSLQDKQRRKLFVLAAFEHELRIAFRHRRFVRPIGGVGIEQVLDLPLLRHAEPSQRIGDRPAVHDIGERCIERVRSAEFSAH